MPKGFFHKEMISNSCGGTCKLNRGCHSPKMPVTGQGKMKILVVAEAPGEREDRQNTQLVGQAGQLLRDLLAEFGVDLDRDCRKTNAVRCRPPDNRKPSAVEITSCQPHIWEEIREHPPKLILLLGQVAVESFLSGRMRKVGTIGRWRGFVVPDQKAKTWVAPTFHPSYILRSREGRAIRGKTDSDTPVEERTLLSDLERALGHLRKPFPTAPEPRIGINRLPDISRPATFSIDYETTGLRPWEQKGHRIISCAFGYETGAAAFPIDENSTKHLKAALADFSIKKVGHNAKFEHAWAAQCLGVETQGWIWDTMLAAHMVDNRKNICGLKHQIYLNFGVEDWSGEINFGEDDEEESLENVSKITAPTDELLRYNSLDAWYCYKLYEKQMKQFVK